MAAIELERKVIERELCTGCGTCIGVCPTGALSWKDDAVRVDHGRCISCGKCYRACPGETFPMDRYAKELFGEPYAAEDILGNYQRILNVKAADERVRDGGASGGAVTQLCIDLLETGAVDGVVAVRAKEGDPGSFESFLARDRRELLAAAQSKYVILPVNEILAKIRETDEKIAFVGLPCQVEGLRKAMAQDEALRDRIKVVISLFCGFNMEAAATRYLIKKSGIAREHIKKLSYRQKRAGETGFFLKGKDGKTFFLPKHGYTFLNLIYAPKRCWKCFDYSGEFADLSVGDAWEEAEGCSRVIVRTKTGGQVLDDALQRGTLTAKESGAQQIKKTQKMVTVYKKKTIDIRAARMRTFPDYGVKLPQSRGKERRFGYVIYLVLCFFHTVPGRLLARLLPLKCLARVSARMKRKEVR